LSRKNLYIILGIILFPLGLILLLFIREIGCLTGFLAWVFYVLAIDEKRKEDKLQKSKDE
jgi:hypothetical protein